MIEGEDPPRLEMLVNHLLVDKPFGKGGNKPLGGGGSGPLGGGDNNLLGGDGEHLGNQNPISYVARPAGPWIGPTWNPWYPSWYHVQPLITPNLPLNRKSLPCRIYTTKMNLDAHVRVFRKAI